MDVASSTEIKPEAFNDLFKSRLDERFMRFQTEAIELAKNQLKLIGDLDAPNKAFITARQTDDSMQQRQRAIMNLETGYRSFIEISQNMNEGQKFYTDFLALLTRFEQAVKDFVFARNVDKKDRMNDLVRNAANFHQ